MELGSFLELQFKKVGEYYENEEKIRLNSGRAAIYHALRCLKKNIVYLPYYQCETVREFLKKKQIEVRYYHINEKFEPVCDEIDSEIPIVLVNYYGIMGNMRMQKLAKQFKHVIVDNCQAFFSKPIEECMNVYSARKFVGVPDGAYVIGEGVKRLKIEYEQDYSSDTSLFLLQRIEYGCEGKAYQSRMLNEKRIDTSDIKRMSKLTETILGATDYENIIKKRKENFSYMESELGSINLIKPMQYVEDDTVPMVYPFVSHNKELVRILLEHKHFQGQWWAYILDEIKEQCMETWLSEYMVPITIDQRYSKEELKKLANLVRENV